ncbi:MAG: amylo-alpha-1,6-glucosidase [Terriglobales bacterium]
MDEASVTQQYYIATKSSPADDRARVLKHGSMFSVFNRLGDIQTRGLGEQGLFWQGTRHLSEWGVFLWNSHPLLLSSTIETNNFLFSADLANLDVSRGDEVVIPRGTLYILRSKFLWRGVCYEEFSFANYGLTDLAIPFRLEFDADFADIFEVRGIHRRKRGRRLPNEVQKSSVLLPYEGLDGVLRSTKLECDPAPHTVSPSELKYDVFLRPNQQAVFQIQIWCDPEPGKVSVGYSRAMAAASSELRDNSESAPQISSSNSRFNDWMKRSFSDVQMMTVGNTEKDYPYAGVPWFSTVFGRDGIITALEMLWLMPGIAKGVLQYLAATQATEVNPEVEAEPGKILHEMRRGEMAALGEVPFGRYYGTVDATPLFIVLAGAYYDRTGDRKFLEQLWPNIQRALAWISDYGDKDGDGFVEYARHSSKGLVQQGWKDSNDSVFHQDGTMAEAPIALCEVQGYVYAAKLAASRICCVLGRSDDCAALKHEADALSKKFEQAFWCKDIATYAIALDGRKKPCRVRTSNVGHCLYTGIASAEKADIIAQGLLGPEFFSGWGVRTVARGEARYNPLSYHNGSIWPHDNALIASGLARFGFKEFAGRILLGLLDVSNIVDLHRLPELFCGLDRRAGEGPTLYPVACSPQAWAAAAGFLVLQACLGVTIEGGPSNKITFKQPTLPDGIPNLWIKGLGCGDASVDLFFERHGHKVRVEVIDKKGEIDVIAH